MPRTVKKRTPFAEPFRPGCQNGHSMPLARALVLGLTVVFGALGCTGQPLSPSPSPNPSPSPSLASSPIPSPVSSQAPSPSLSVEAQILAVEGGVPALRGLESLAGVPNRILDEAGLRAELVRVVDASMTPQQFAAASRFGQRLGLLPAGLDLRQVQLDLLGEQVLGFYDDDTRVMTLVQRGAAFGPLEKATLAHEYTHALQDQHFDLDSLRLDDLSNGDRAQARLALVEGDATLLTTRWAGRNLTPAELLTLTLEGLDPAQQAVLASLPPILRRQLVFPYVDGLTFVSGLQTEGGWPAVDAAYVRPPDSTEQILHPAKYADREQPVAVAAPDESGRLGSGWSQSLSDTLGELTIDVWLASSAGPAGAADAAAGWGGDRVAMYEGPGGAWLIAWFTAWDSPADAMQFNAAATAAVAPDVAWVLGAAGSSTVSVVLASDPALLERLFPAP